MKKLMFAAAVAAGLAALGIESANTVGYTTKTIPAGKYMMVAVQFDKIGGTALKFDEAFSLSVTGPKAWESIEDPECIPGWYADAPCLKIPLGTVDKAYLDLFFSSNAYSMDLDDFVVGWADKDGCYVSDAVIPEGMAFWLVVPAPVTSTITK